MGAEWATHETTRYQIQPTSPAGLLHSKYELHRIVQFQDRNRFENVHDVGSGEWGYSRQARSTYLQYRLSVQASVWCGVTRLGASDSPRATTFHTSRWHCCEPYHTPWPMNQRFPVCPQSHGTPIPRPSRTHESVTAVAQLRNLSSLTPATPPYFQAMMIRISTTMSKGAIVKSDTLARGSSKCQRRPIRPSLKQWARSQSQTGHSSVN